MKQNIKKYLPLVAFFSGFLWDELTIGRQINPSDLWILTGYLLLAALILYWMGHKRHAHSLLDETSQQLAQQVETKKPEWVKRAPLFILQFLFGGLFSALFILYFKSANHLLAIFWSLGLGALLVANERLDHHYHRYTLTWAIFGLCAILVFNFVLPFVLGSILSIWFYLSTLAGASLTHFLRKKTPGCPGRAAPVWIIAGVLSLAYFFDFVPPVPLVKRDMQIGLDLTKSNGDMAISVERAPWYKPWRLFSNDVYVESGAKVYCASSVFAPPGINTKLYHRWEHYDKQHGWQTDNRIGFDLSGGREGGFRGYTYKQNIQPGEWRVEVEAESGKTLTVYHFNLHSESLGDTHLESKTL